jgi:hypothetical protein
MIGAMRAVLYDKEGVWENPRHSTKAYGHLLLPALTCGEHETGVLRRGPLLPARRIITSMIREGANRVWMPVVVGSGEAGAGAADGCIPVRRTTQTRTNFWRRLLRLASAV